MKQILSLLCIVAMCAMITISCSDDNDETTKTFTVTFDSQGGSSVSAQTVAEGEKATQPTAPTKEGVVFGGWYSETDYTHAWDFEKNVVTTDITLYARWASKTFTVKFDTDGGNSIEDMKVADGGLIASLPIPTKADRAFDGWYTDKTYNTKFTITTPITDNITLYAKWVSVSKDALQKLVEESYNLKSSNYTEASYKKMEDMRTAANTILNKPTPTASEISTAYQNLSNAINELVELAVRPVVALEIYPEPIDNVVYLNPTNEYFDLYAQGIDAYGNDATNNKVVFIYDKNELESWAKTPEGEESKIEENDNGFSFHPKDNLATDKQISITIKSADNTIISKTITLKIINSENAKTTFLSIVNSLPEASTLTFENYEEYYKKADEAETFYNYIDYEQRAETNIQTAYNKLDAFHYGKYEFNKISYRFDGNICFFDGDTEEPYTYTRDGNFPAGTYVSSWDEDKPGYYYQDRTVLKSDGTYQQEYRESNNANGTNAGNWEKESSGEYKFTGNQINGGTITLHKTWDIDYDNSLNRGFSTSRMRKAKTILAQKALR